MKTFVMFGVIEFIDDEAIVHSVSDARFMDMDAAETHANEKNLDWIAPHYCTHRITFIKFAKETDYA